MRARRTLIPSLRHAFLVAVVLVWSYPFLWVASSAFKSRQEMLLGGLSLIPREFTLDNFSRAWNVANFGSYTVNTVLFSVGAVIGVLIISAPAGYALGRGNVPGKKIIVGALVATMFLPHGYTIIPVFQLVSTIHLQNSLAGAILATVGPAHVVPILLFMGYFRAVPQELEEAARIDGAGYVRTFVQIMLPLARPVVGTVSLFTFIAAWNAFFIPLIFTLGVPELRTLGVGMFAFYGQYSTDWTGLAAAGCISLSPIIVVFLFLQRTFVEGMAGAIKQ